MSGTTLERPDVAAYLAAVRSELADLPPEERDDLLADVEASLLDSGEPPRTAPADFAAELREAAGLGRTDAPQAPPRSALETVRALLASERAAALAGAARDLAPLWWLARAYVAVALVALAAGWGWPLGSGTHSLTAGIGTSALVLAAAAVVSLWLGLRGRRGRDPYPRLRLAANVALALALLPIAAHSLDRFPQRTVQPEVQYEPLPGLAYDGVPVWNVYPYSRDGKLLLDVLLYDDQGRPLAIGGAVSDPYRRFLTTPDGTPITNSFPIRYFEPGTERVARPYLAPPVELPEVATPALGEEAPG
ncbi:MAG TPA: hypothetical protein VEY87_03950 [Gaiellaceae bacterium]|jgi:hypothetical protein|nr:hypothetical protein [Gaiellaceae bacterium]